MIIEADKPYLLIGYKQSVKAIETGIVKTVYIAKDCEERLSQPIIELAKNKSCEIVFSDTMRELGKMCGIDKGASCAVIKKH